ncbi:MAG: phosphatase PAP2 family protein [Gemmatimonadota bacterium]
MGAGRNVYAGSDGGGDTGSARAAPDAAAAARAERAAPGDDDVRSGVRPVDRMCALYAVVSGAALVFPHRPAGWPWIALAHAVAVALLLRLGLAGPLLARIGRRAPRLTGFLHDAYPLLLVPALYGELAALNVAVHDGRYFDEWIIGWEALLFGGQPSRDLAGALPVPLLSEVLHGAYLSYYLIIYAPPLALYLAARREAFREVVFALMLTFFVHYLFFIYFPVQGPRYLFEPPVVEEAAGPLYGLAHAVLETGSSRGAAFPSSHVGIAAAQTLLVARFLPLWLPVVALLSVGLAAGAVYGGFHYATDALAGLALGLPLAALAPAVRHRLDR